MARRRPAAARDVMRAAFYSLWGVLTLALLFAVTLLFMRLSERERDLEAIAPVAHGSVVVRDATEAPERGRARLYFAHPSALQLIGEDRPMTLTESTLENCRAAVLALSQGSTSGGVPVLSPATRVRAMYLLESGELVVDFSRAIDAPELHSAAAEWLLVQALAHTLTQSGLRGAQDRPVTSVRILYEGSPAGEEGFPSHIQLAGPMRPDPRLLGG